MLLKDAKRRSLSVALRVWRARIALSTRSRKFFLSEEKRKRTMVAFP
jgi:hypothetical protein